jgi:hypothetical protein
MHFDVVSCRSRFDLFRVPVFADVPIADSADTLLFQYRVLVLCNVGKRHDLVVVVLDACKYRVICILEDCDGFNLNRLLLGHKN